MAEKEINALPNITTPSAPVFIDPEKCVACNACVEVCPVDVYIPDTEKGSPPIVLHPDECWYCGSCVNACNYPGAITFNWPVQQRGSWKDKVNGQVLRDKYVPGD